MCCGRVLQSGDLSWFKRSISSLVICLKEEISDFKSCNFEWTRISTHIPYIFHNRNRLSRYLSPFSTWKWILTWWHEEVLFSCRNLAVRNAADWGIRQLVSQGIRFRTRSRSLWQGEWLLLEKERKKRKNKWKENKMNLLWDNFNYATHHMEMREFFYRSFTIQWNEKFVYKFFLSFFIH